MLNALLSPAAWNQRLADRHSTQAQVWLSSKDLSLQKDLRKWAPRYIGPFEVVKTINLRWPYPNSLQHSRCTPFSCLSLFLTGRVTPANYACQPACMHTCLPSSLAFLSTISKENPVEQANVFTPWLPASNLRIWVKRKIPLQHHRTAEKCTDCENRLTLTGSGFSSGPASNCSLS